MPPYERTHITILQVPFVQSGLNLKRICVCQLWLGWVNYNVALYAEAAKATSSEDDTGNRLLFESFEAQQENLQATIVVAVAAACKLM